MPADDGIVYLNGSFLPLAKAKVSVLDRGFLFGDGVYEVVPVYGGHPFRLDHHLDRLDQSLAAIRLTNPLTRQHWRDLLHRLIAENSDGDQSLYLQLTRGVSARDHAFPPAATPTVFAMVTPLVAPSEALLKTGLTAITVEDIRWKYCHIKSIALLPNVLLKQEALDQGADEAILMRNGEVTEGTASNIFMVKDGLVTTPAKSHLLLPGVTRDVLVELCAEHGIPCRESVITVDELRCADEIWISSSTREVLAVTRLDGLAVGQGEPGPLAQRMITLYRDYIQAVRDGRRH